MGAGSASAVTRRIARSVGTASGSGTALARSPTSSFNFVTSPPTLGTLQRNSNGTWGMRITVGSSLINVQSLGRWVVSGNTQSHTVSIVDTSGNVVPGGSVTVNTSGKPAGAFTYTNLAAPVTLQVGGIYAIVCDVSTVGDFWYYLDTVITTTSDAHDDGSCNIQGGGISLFGNANTCPGPLDFTYTLGPRVNVGSPFPVTSKNDIPNIFIFGNTAGTVVSGTINIDGQWAGDNNVPPINSMVAQYFIDGKPVSPYLLGPPDTFRLAPNFPWTFDTTKLTNGTHHFILRFIDTTAGIAAYRYRCYPAIFLVQNPPGVAVGDYSGQQLVPTSSCHTSPTSGATPPIPDFITYTGAPQSMNSHPRQPLFIAPSVATQDAKYRNYGELYIEDMSSLKEQEFSDNPIFATTLQGGVFIDYTSVDTGGGTIQDFYPLAFRSATRPGGRCNALTTPLSTFIAAEGSDPLYGADTGYLGIELRGSLIHLAWNGNVTLLAGISWDQTKLAFNNYYARDFVSEDLILDQCQVIGNIVSPTFGIDEFGGLNDLCQDPRDATGKTIYLANALDNFIIKVDRNFNPPHCQVYAGVPGTASYVNQPSGGGAVNAQFDQINSIVMCDGTVAGYPAGTMLVADLNNSAIRKITPDGLTVTTLCGNQTSKPSIAQLTNSSISDTWSPSGSVGFTPNNDTTGAYVNTPFTIRWASNNPTQRRLVVYENNTATLRIIDLVSNTITRIPNTKGITNVGNPYSSWAWMDVDTRGVLGPVDDIALANGVAAGAPYLRSSIDGSFVAAWIGDGTGRLAEGPGNQAGTVFAPMPVYGWAACFAKTRSHFVGGGFRYWGIYAARPRAPSDPTIDVNARIGLDVQVFDRASNVGYQGIWFNGTSVCFPLGARPGFADLYGEYGNGLLGSSVVPSFDDLAATYSTDGDFTAEICAVNTLGRYLQNGGAGQVPRPELTGNDLRALCYYIRRAALSGTYPTTVAPGSANTDTIPPLITNVSAVRVSSDSLGNPRLQVTWTTDKRTIGMAVAGSAYNRALGYYSVWSPIEPSFGTTHSAIITGVPDSVPLHYAVVAKDVAGNSAYSDDQIISYSSDGSIIIGQAAGGGNGVLRTQYGVWEMGSVQAPHDGTNAGTFCMPMLNGVQANPAGPTGAFGIPSMMQLWVKYGGNLYGVGNDQIWSQWDGYTWLNNLGADFASGPSSSPTPEALPNYNPPYTPSPENTSISGGSGSLITADGVWTFGSAGSGGFRLQLNGIDVKEAGPGFIFVNQMTVYGHGRMFFHRSDTPAWKLWAMYQQNTSTGPTSLPVPVDIRITPSRPSIPAGSAPGFPVATVAVAMSDGSTFSGSLSLNDMTYFTISGSSIVVNTPPPTNFYVLLLSAAQNGSAPKIYVNLGVS